MKEYLRHSVMVGGVDILPVGALSLTNKRLLVKSGFATQDLYANMLYGSGIRNAGTLAYYVCTMYW